MRLARLFIFLALVGFSVPAWAAPTFVQPASTGIGFPGGSTQTVVFPSNPTAGNAILFSVVTSPTTNTISVTDANGDTFTVDNTQSTPGTWVQIQGHAVNVVGGTGSKTLTVTCLSACSFGGFVAIAEEWSGLATTTPLDGTPVNAGLGAATSLSPGSVTTTNANSLAWTVLWTTSASTVTTPAGFTLESNNLSSGLFYTAFKIGSGTQTPTWNITPAEDMFTALIGVKPAGGGGAVVPKRTLMGAGQ